MPVHRLQGAGLAARGGMLPNFLRPRKPPGRGPRRRARSPKTRLCSSLGVERSRRQVLAGSSWRRGAGGEKLCGFEVLVWSK